MGLHFVGCWSIVVYCRRRELYDPVLELMQCIFIPIPHRLLMMRRRVLDRQLCRTRQMDVPLGWARSESPSFLLIA